MKYIIDKEKRPAYLQLYNQIRDDIVSEILQFNSKLPSIRSLADELGISTITVEHAYSLLCDEGYVDSRERSGFVVIFRKSDGFAASSEHHTTHIAHHTHQSYPDFPLSVLRKTMRRVLTDRGELLLDKSPNCGCLELREAIRHYLARNRGIKVDVEQIIIGSGSEYLYGLIVELLGRHRTYAIESPSYKKIEQVYKATHISYESLPLTNSGINSKALAESKADILHTTPFRSYPSGVTATASKRHEYIRWSEKDNRYIIEDEQGGKQRAEYGKGVLKRVSALLTASLGKGWSVDTLEKTRRFFLTFSKSATPQRILAEGENSATHLMLGTDPKIVFSRIIRWFRNNCVPL